MIDIRLAKQFLLPLTIILIVWGFLGIFGLKLISAFVYILAIWGIFIFYSSYVKKYKIGISFGSFIYLTGTILLINIQYEILQFGSVFVPSLLLVIGLSIIIPELLISSKKINLILSLLCIIAGSWLVIKRSNTTADLFISSVYSLIKKFFVIILLSAGIVFLVYKNFRNKEKDID